MAMAGAHASACSENEYDELVGDLGPASGRCQVGERARVGAFEDVAARLRRALRGMPVRRHANHLSTCPQDRGPLIDGERADVVAAFRKSAPTRAPRIEIAWGDSVANVLDARRRTSVASTKAVIVALCAEPPRLPDAYWARLLAADAEAAATLPDHTRARREAAAASRPARPTCASAVHAPIVVPRAPQPKLCWWVSPRDEHIAHVVRHWRIPMLPVWEEIRVDIAERKIEVDRRPWGYPFGLAPSKWYTVNEAGSPKRKLRAKSVAAWEPLSADSIVDARRELAGAWNGRTWRTSWGETDPFKGYDAPRRDDPRRLRDTVLGGSGVSLGPLETRGTTSSEQRSVAKRRLAEAKIDVAWKLATTMRRPRGVTGTAARAIPQDSCDWTPRLRCTWQHPWRLSVHAEECAQAALAEFFAPKNAARLSGEDTIEKAFDRARKDVARTHRADGMSYDEAMHSLFFRESAHATRERCPNVYEGRDAETMDPRDDAEG